MSPGGRVSARHFLWFAVYAALVSNRIDRAQALRRQGEALGGIHSDRVLAMAAARARGHPEEAVKETTGLYSPRDLSQALAFHAADWALQDGRTDEAVAGATESMALPIFPPHLDVAGFRAALWPRALLLRARAHEARGDLSSAWADVSRLLELWRNADGDAPDVAQAPAMRLRLSSAK